MTIYTMLIFIWILIWIFFKRDQKKLFLIISIFLLFLLMGLRSYNIGTDTYSYCMNYLENSFISWRDIFCREFSLGNSNYGFFTLNKLIYLIFPENYTFYLVSISGIVSFSIYKFMRKFSKNYLMSLIILLSLGFIFFFMSGIKQTLAISFILLSYIKLKEEKYLKFILMVFLAASFHNTALIVLSVLGVQKFKIKKIYFLLVPSMIVFSILFQRKIVYFLQKMVSGGKYATYGTDYVSTNNLTGLYIQCIILLVTFILVGYRLRQDKELEFYVSIYSIGIFFQTLTPVIAEFFRISMYFSVISCVMLPYAILNSKYRQKKFIIGIMILFFIFYFYIANRGNEVFIPYELFFDNYI